MSDSKTEHLAQKLTVEEALQVLRKHLPERFGPNVTCETSLVTGGLSNENYFVTAIEGDNRTEYVMRIKRKVNSGVDWHTAFQEDIGGNCIVEEHMVKAGAACDLAPQLIFYSRPGQSSARGALSLGEVMLTKKLADTHTLKKEQMKDRNVIRQVLETLNEFNAAPIPDEVPQVSHVAGYRPFGVSMAMLRVCRVVRSWLPDDVDDIFSQLSVYDSALATCHCGFNKACHNDLVPANILRRPDDSLVFVDFEFAGRGCPLFDLAKISSLCELTPEEDANMLDEWLRITNNTEAAESVRSRFQLNRVMNDLMNAMWAASVHAQSPDKQFSAEWCDFKSYVGYSEHYFAAVRKALRDPSTKAHLRRIATVRKAIIPVAGVGTRMFPATKTLPKCFLPIVDANGVAKPAIHEIIQSVIDGGIEQICIVASKDQIPMLHGYFREEPDPRVMTKDSCQQIQQSIRDMNKRITIVEQRELGGFGHALLCAEAFVARAPVLIVLGDHLYQSAPNAPSCITQVVNTFAKFQSNILGVSPEPEEQLPHIGAWAGTLSEHPDIYVATGGRAKPATAWARKYLQTEGLAVQHQYLGEFGLYVLLPNVFESIRKKANHINISQQQEVNVTDSLVEMATPQQQTAPGGDDSISPPVALCRVRGRRFDIGIPPEYRKTLSPDGYA